MAAAADDQQPVASAIDAYQANVLFINGFGLQLLPQEWLAESLLAPFSRTQVKPPTLTDFIVCMCNRYTTEELDKLREIVPGLEQDDFAGHNYLQVPWHEYDRIEQLMNVVLQTRDAFLACKCYPKYARGSVFAWSTFEQKMIETGRFSTEFCKHRLPSVSRMHGYGRQPRDRSFATSCNPGFRTTASRATRTTFSSGRHLHSIRANFTHLVADTKTN